MIKNTMVRENSSVYGGIARNWKRHSLLNCFLYELVGSNPIMEAKTFSRIFTIRDSEKYRMDKRLVKYRILIAQDVEYLRCNMRKSAWK